MNKLKIEKNWKSLFITNEKYYRLSDLHKLFILPSEEIEKLQDDIMQAFLDRKLKKGLFRYTENEEIISLLNYEYPPGGIEYFYDSKLNHRNWQSVKTVVKWNRYYREYYDYSTLLINSNDFSMFNTRTIIRIKHKFRIPSQLVEEKGFEPLNANAGRFTVCCH